MDKLSVLKALANDKRLLILEYLKKPSLHFVSEKGDVDRDGVCVGLIEKKLKLSQSTVSQYLMALQKAGLIKVERRGQWTYYKRDEEGIQAYLKTLQDL